MAYSYKVCRPGESGQYSSVVLWRLSGTSDQRRRDEWAAAVRPHRIYNMIPYLGMEHTDGNNCWRLNASI